MHTDRELQMFIRGEIREQGWKSPWRVDQERRRAEERSSLITYQPEMTRVPPNRPYLVCRQCPAKISRMSKSGCCRKCGAKRVAKKKCIFCNQELRKVNTTGRCMKHRAMKEAA